jgi:hypothetical protein
VSPFTYFHIEQCLRIKSCPNFRTVLVKNQEWTHGRSFRKIVSVRWYSMTTMCKRTKTIAFPCIYLIDEFVHGNWLLCFPRMLVSRLTLAAAEYEAQTSPKKLRADYHYHSPKYEYATDFNSGSNCRLAHVRGLQRSGRRAESAGEECSGNY